MDDAVEIAWGIIANAHGGNWDEATPEWKAAAERWRDKYVAPLRPSPAFSVRKLSDAQLLQALKNVGCHVADCGACAEVFFTGSKMHDHTCPRER